MRSFAPAHRQSSRSPAVHLPPVPPFLQMASSGTSGGQEEYLQDTLREVEGRLEAVLAEVKKSSAEHQAEITALRQESDRTIAELTNEVGRPVK